MLLHREREAGGFCVRHFVQLPIICEHNVLGYYVTPESMTACTPTEHVVVVVVVTTILYIVHTLCGGSGGGGGPCTQPKSTREIYHYMISIPRTS